MSTEHQLAPQARVGRHRLARPPRRPRTGDSDGDALSVDKPGYLLHIGDLGASITFTPLLWNEEMTGELRQIHATADRLRIVVAQTETQKGLYPRYSPTGDPDAPYLADYDIDFDDDVTVRDRS